MTNGGYVLESVDSRVQTTVKKLQEAAETRGKAQTPTQTPIKSEPVSPNIDIESLYASEEDDRPGPSQGRGDPMEQINEDTGQRQEAAEPPGDTWTRRWNGSQFGLGNDEALERWHPASEASRQRRMLGQQEAQEPQQQGGSGTRDPSDEQACGQRRSVTQPYEVGFGRQPNPPTPFGSGRQASERGRQNPGGGSSGSSDESRQGGGGPNHRSQTGSHTSSRHTNKDGCSSKPRRKRSPSSSSSPSSLDDWDSDFTVLDDEDRRWQEKREQIRNPKMEYEREQLRRIRGMIRKMVGQEIRYAASYKGVRDVVTIIKYAGQNDSGIFMGWLDHLLMYFQLNRMCGPDNELVRLSAMYNSLEGVAEEWYCDLILHMPKRSWTFEKAVCSLFLTYMFGSAASQAAREFSEVRYSRTGGAREYAQRLKTKARQLARKPDESTMIVRFLAGLPGELGRRLTQRERLDPGRHRFKHFVAKLHELEEAENVTRTVNSAVVDEQWKTGSQGLLRPDGPRFDNEHSLRRSQRAPVPQHSGHQLMRRRENQLAEGRGPSVNVVCFRCQGKGHYASDPACPMFGKGGGPNRSRSRTQLRATRVPEGRSGANRLDNPPEETGDTGEWDDGSQWESATEGEGSLHSYEDIPRMHRISVMDVVSEPEGGDCVCVWEVRERAVALQREDPLQATIRSKIDRPRRPKAFGSCIATYVVINGTETFTLFDSGSSVDAISPNFAQASNTRVHTLDKPVPLQLGTIGNRASVDYGTWVPVELGDKKEDRYYLDVTDIDGYDAILGVPLMRKFGVRLDFDSNSLTVGGTMVEALLLGEETVLIGGPLGELIDEACSDDRGGDLCQISLGESTVQMAALSTVSEKAREQVHRPVQQNRSASERGQTLSSNNPPWTPMVAIQPVGIRSRFFPLGIFFREGGTGGPLFSRPQDWPDEIYRNSPAWPRGLQHWGTYPVCLDDLHVYLRIGQMVYRGNRPPGRRNPIENQQPWKAIESTSFRERVVIILQPRVFTKIHDQLSPDQRTLDCQPFLSNVVEPNQLATDEVVQHLITESWTRHSEVIGFTRAYLREWARHQTWIIVTTDMGHLFLDLYPDGIANKDNPHFIKDMELSYEVWGETRTVAPMGEVEYADVPPLESVTPSTTSPQESPGAWTPLEERVDWGVDDH